MADGDEARLQVEQRARVCIDHQLTAAGWAVQDKKDLNLFTGPGVAVRETVMATGHGRADYLLHVDKRPCGVIEAKPEGTPLSGVEWQSATYASGLTPAARGRAVLLGDRLDAASAVALQRVHGLRASLLSAAFTGQLTERGGASV